ncbi:MAG TPA: RNA 2',3'-cyclic phosphodiesterase [Thermodesulfobacteriota bacterium]
MRVFIAALIPEEIKEEINQYLVEVKPHWEGVKWENYNKLHVTLKFLGEIEGSVLGEIKDILNELLPLYSPFEMKISCFGGFPNLNNPRVLFISLSKNHELIRLQRDLEERLEVIGLKRENRTFKPHITVGRIKGKARSKSIFPFPNNTTFFITQIAVMKSELGQEGSQYTPLFVFRLVN